MRGPALSSRPIGVVAVGARETGGGGTEGEEPEAYSEHPPAGGLPGPGGVLLPPGPTYFGNLLDPGTQNGPGPLQSQTAGGFQDVRESAGFNVFKDGRPSYFTREFFYRE